jgi:integrase/recombinase XerC/integrase/recombinase XerD
LDVKYPGIAAADVSMNTIREFLLDEIIRNSPSTACHCHTTLSVFFGYMVTEGLIKSTPMKSVEKPKRRRTIIDTFTPEQVELILSTCGNDFYGIRDRCMILIMLDCGLRVSELVGLTLDNIALEDQTFIVVGKGNKERMVPYGDTVKNVLVRYLGRRAKIVENRLLVNCYGKPISRYSVREIISRKGDRVGITGVRCSPHTFRHTCAVQFLRSGGDIFTLQRLLGHSTLEMTKRYCESLNAADVQNKHRLYSPVDNMNLSAKTSSRKRIK